MRLALQLNHPVHDCLYLALAKRLGAYVVNANTHFGQAVADPGTYREHIRGRSIAAALAHGCSDIRARRFSA